MNNIIVIIVGRKRNATRICTCVNIANVPPGGGHSTFFQVGVCGPDFRRVGLANWHLPLKRGACERKFPNFGGLWAKIWVKIEAVEAKISKFSQKGVLWTDSFAWNGTLAGEAWKGGLQGRTSLYPLSRSVPPRECTKWRSMWKIEVE